MKRIILICLVLISAKAFSQETQPKGFLQDLGSRLSFGLKGGVNYSNFNNANFSTDPLVGFHAGATVSLKFNDHFSVVEDFLYSAEGAKSKSTLFGGQDIKLSYMDVPILIRYKTTPGIFIEAGTQTGIKIKEDVMGITNAGFAKKLNIGAIGGIGYQGQKGLGISVRYIYGLTQVSNTNIIGVNNDFKSATAQASLFYNF